ncbi:MAG: hypothetical protein EBU90_09105 [Proteobacteria bacterium]|nr:hypothetical protein [Pseudomonadota bacterium]NBP15334.1 hypothetical protein [bacterium]
MNKLFRKRPHSENIFRQHADEECRLLNSKCRQLGICGKDDDGNIFKLCTSEDVFNWEVAVYLDMLEANIFPYVSTAGKLLTYSTKSLVSVRTFLQQQPRISFAVFLHELCSFVNSFRKYRFLHGNLHVDNIFVHPTKFHTAPRFFVIDYANSFILKKRHSFPIYTRTSFMEEYDVKLNFSAFTDWDFITLYVSLKQLFFQQGERLSVIDNVIISYIKKESLDQGIRYYESTRLRSHEYPNAKSSFDL